MVCSDYLLDKER